ncbi:MAG: molybdenum cofactor biosynthesis protein MoaE [Kangiellaceae bacterium]
MCEELIITNKSLDLSNLNQQIQAGEGEHGASVIFTGAVRVSKEEHGLVAMHLEHYPGMTEKELTRIIDDAKARWELSKALIVHRIGRLLPGEPIVFVGVCSLHREAAFQAAQFIMDFLKNKATFWKKEIYYQDGKNNAVWVEAKDSDEQALNRW